MSWLQTAADAREPQGYTLLWMGRSSRSRRSCGWHGNLRRPPLTMTPAKLVPQVLGVIAEFDKAMGFRISRSISSYFT
jgi:hypothetical protein